MRPAVARLLLSAASSPDYGQRFVPAAAQPQRGDLEAACEVRRAAGTKGRGVFAAEPMEAGRWVCRYAGKVVTDGSSPPFDPLGLMPDRASTANLELVDTASEDVLELCPGLFIDAKDSSHFSRFVNHAEHGAPGGSRGLRLGSGCRAQRLQPWARGEPREPGGVCRASPRTCLLLGSALVPATRRQPRRARECGGAASRLLRGRADRARRRTHLQLRRGLLARCPSTAQRRDRLAQL